MRAGRVVLAGMAVVSALCGAALATIDVRLDFSNAAAVTDSSWNTINTTNATNVAMVNHATGNTSDGITASVVTIRGTIARGTTTNNWQGTNGPSWLDSGQNSAKDYFSMNTNSGMQLVFNGLNPSIKYTVEAISSRNSTSGYDNQNSAWQVIGLASSGTTSFNSVTQGYQSGQWLSWTAISPDATGAIKVQVGSIGGNTPNLYFNAARLYCPSPTITTTSPLADGVVGTAYSQALAATDGSSPYSWSVSAGSLPGGLTLSGAGVLSGTPSATGTSSFTVQVTDSNNVTGMKDFTLTVNAAPTITAQPESQTVMAGECVVLSVVATGTPAPTYQWKKDNADIGGATTDSLTFNSVALTDAGSYVCVVTNVAGSVTSDAATLTVNPANTAPVAEAGGDQTITLPAAATLSGSATDDGRPNPPGALTYTWTKDSGPGTVTFADPSAASTTATFSTNGTYVLRLTSSDGILSGDDTVTVTVEAAAPPAAVVDVRVDFSNAAAVTDDGWNTINTTNATNVPMVNLATGDTNDGITASVVTIRGTIARGSTTNNWQSGNIGPAWMDTTQNAAKDYFSTGSNSGMQLVFHGLNPSLPYTVEVISSKNSTSGYDNANSTWQAIGLTTSSQTFNSVANGYTNGQWLTWNNVSPDASGTIKVQVGSSGGTTPNLYINAARLFYIDATSTTITSRSPLSPATVGVAYSRKLEAAGGAAPYAWSVTSGSLPNGLTLSSAGLITGTPTAVSTSTFTVRAADSNNVSDSKSLSLTVNSIPTITTQPQSQTTAVGLSVSLSVVATGSPAPTYQWQRNSVNVVGATSATLTLNPVSLDNAGSYTCIVSNVAGSVTSSAATLTVNPGNTAPTVDAGTNQTITFPATASLSGSATDDGLPTTPGTISYTWSKDIGPGTVTFTDPNAASTTATFSTYGIYSLRLTASDGALSSYDTVTIAVDPATAVSLNIEDFNNTTDGTYNNYTGTRITGQSHLTGWELGGRFIKFESVNGDRMMSTTQAYSAFDVGIALAPVSADNEDEPVWDPAQASEALDLSNVDQLQFQFMSRSSTTKTQGGDMNIYMYYYDTSESATRKALVAVIPSATSWDPGEVKTAIANIGCLPVDKTVDKVYGFRVFPNGGPGSCGLTSISAVNGAFPVRRITNVRTGLTYPTLGSAAADLADNDTIEIGSGTYVGYEAWAQIKKDNITLRGVGPTRPVLDSNNNCILSKGLLVISADDCTIENLELANARSAYTANAAAVRMEGINLTIRGCYLHDSGNGLLESNVHDSNILLEYDEFNHNGGNSGGSTHNMYIGHCASLTIRYCWSHNAQGEGHELKSRARVNYILYNRLGDEGGNGSYECSTPNGGTTYVIGNMIEQSPSGANTIIIDYGSENTAVGQNPNPDQHLYVMNNTVVNHMSGGFWLRVNSDTVSLVQNNIFQGPASTSWWGPSTRLNNWITTDAHLVASSGFDYHLTSTSTGAIDLGGVPDPTTGIDGFSLIPDKQYSHPCNYVTRPTNGTIDIGAYEYAN